MSDQGAEVVRRKVTTRRLEPGSGDEPTLTVHYVIHKKFSDGTSEKSDGEKVLTLRTLSARSDVPTLADEIISRCKYVNRERKENLEHVLRAMQSRYFGRDSGPGAAADGSSTERGRDMIRERGEDRMRMDMMDRPGTALTGPGRRAQLRQQYQQQEEEVDGGIVSLDDLEEYMESLYDEEMADKVKGTRRIVRLAQDPDNLDHLASHETLLGALARVLREENRRSMDLTVNIAYIFWSLSNFVQFHGVLAQHQAGLMCMKIIEHEIKRTAVMEAEVKGKDALASKRYKQDRVLFVCFHVLLNLAQDLNVEVKMLRKGLVRMLVEMLPRRNEELLIVVVTFLKKLSIFRENKDSLAEAGVVPLLPALLPARDPILQRVLVGFLLNLSFDASLRAQMVEAGFIPKLVSLVRDPDQRVGALSVLYHFSQDDAARSMFSYTDAIPLLVRIILETPYEAGTAEAVALAINLAHHPRNAEQLVAAEVAAAPGSPAKADALASLLARATAGPGDPLLLKLLRNLSQHEEERFRMRFVPHIAELVRFVRSCDNTDCLVEAVGALGNLEVDGYDYARLMEDFGLVRLIHALLSQHPGGAGGRDGDLGGGAEDDLVLETVMWCATLLSDEDVPAVFAPSSLIRDLFKVLQERQDDPEMVLQVVYVFLRLLTAEETRGVVLLQTQIVYYLVDFVYNERPETARLADNCLDIIADEDMDWAAKIRQKKFELHNAEWVSNVEQEEGDEWVGEEEDESGDMGLGYSGREHAVYDLSQFDDDWNDDNWGEQ